MCLFVFVSLEYCSFTPMSVPRSLLALPLIVSFILKFAHFATICLGLPCFLMPVLWTLSRSASGRPSLLHITS